MFNERFDSFNKQQDTSNRPYSMYLSDVRSAEDDDHVTLEALVRLITTLVSMENPKDRDEELNVRYFRKAVVGANRVLYAISRLLVIPSYQLVISALNSSQREAALHKTAKTPGTSSSFRTSLWKQEPCDDAKDILSYGQRWFGRAPHASTQSK